MTQDFTGIPQFMGARVRRREDPALITGEGKYTADFKQDGTLYLGFVRSPYAHAKILEIDIASAQEMEGVVAVLTGKALLAELSGTVPSGMPVSDPPYSEGKLPTRALLCTDKVRFTGEPVAVVIATSPAIAADAVELIFADYDPLDVVVDPDEALKPGAPLIHDGENNIAFRWGPVGPDVTEIFENAAYTVELRVENQRVIANAMEPRAAFASHDASSGVTTLWSTTQNPHTARDGIAGILGIEADQLRVIAPEVGGGFGIKAPVYTEEIIATHLTHKFNKPIKWVASRTEDYVSTYHGRGQTDIIRLAADKDGKIEAADLKIMFDVGGYYSGVAPLIPTLTVLMASGVYAIPAIHADVTAVFTNKHPAEPYRGAGRPEAAYLIERAVSALADEMGIDAAEIRRRNYIPSDAFPYTTATGAVYDSGDYEPGLNKVLELVDYDQLRREQDKRRTKGDNKLLGIGVATYVEVCGFGPWEMGSVYMDSSAKVTVLTGTSPHGQGHQTAWAQIAADVLQIPPEDIIVKHGDTGVVPRGVGTFGSRSAAVGGSAVHNNSQTVLEKGKQIAAHLLEASVEDVVIQNGRFQVVGSQQVTVSWPEIAAAAEKNDLPEDLQGGLESDTDFTPSGNLYPFGSHVAVVEVDAQTGTVEIVRYVTMDDCGKVINPLLVEGQVHGGLAQGIGQALYEGSVYDESGNLISGSLMDYALPRADSFPHFNTNRTETPSPLNPIGVKGIGEAATIGSTPAIVNAVVDALSHLGVRHIDMPLTAEKLWQAMR